MMKMEKDKLFQRREDLMGLGNGLVSYFAAIFPFQVMKESWGLNYGKGELGFIILVISAISAAIIFIVGINVATIFTVFVVYLYTTLKGLRDISMGREAEKNNILIIFWFIFHFILLHFIFI